MGKREAYAKLAGDFQPANVTTSLGLFGAALDVLGKVFEVFGDELDRSALMELAASFWDDIVVPYDVPKIGPMLEKTIERALRPMFLALAEKALDQIGVE